MSLTLRAVSLNDVPLTQSISARFDPAGGTIGRADSNTMALPDPERHISRQQAEVVGSPDGYSIRNVGSANPIMVRNQSLLQGESAPLGDRDQVRIGGYLLEVLEDPANEQDATQVVKTLVPPVSRTADPAAHEPRSRAGATNKASNVIGDFNTPLSNTNPFANLIGGEPPAPAPPPSPPPPMPIRASSPPVARLPDDFDPFAAPVVKAPSEPVDALPRASGVFDDLIPSAPSRSIDDLFGLNASTSRDSLADFVSEAPAPVSSPTASQPIGPSTDPMAMFDGPSALSRTTPQPRTESNHVPELNAEFRPPRPLAARPAAEAVPAAPVPSVAAAPVTTVVEPPVAAPSREATAARPPAADPDDPLVAFCRGAGIQLDRSRGLDPGTMETVGAMLRAAIDGTMQLIAVRSATRQELHAQVTIIRPKDNNPLKFSPDAEAAFEQMLAPPIRGFLGGPDAMLDAMNDLVGHAIGTMAGTRAALEGVLGRFAPNELEARLERKSLLDSVLPMNRRAKLWDLYVQHYVAIHDEAQEDFHALFGKAFMAAYEEQLERLRDEKTPSFD